MFWHRALVFLHFIAIDAQLSQPITSYFKCLPNGCCDEHEWCRLWASIGKCNVNSKWMFVNCQLACNSCPTESVIPSIEDGAKCELILQKNLSNISYELKRQNLVNPIEDVSFDQLTSVDEIKKAANTGCVPKLKTRECLKSLCYHLSYRTYDGICNNFNRPSRGSAFQPFLRLLPSAYDDGVGKPVSSLQKTRPSAREAIRSLLASDEYIKHEKFNAFIFQWGQFISHDIVKTTFHPHISCKMCNPVKPQCMVVTILANDTNMEYQRRGCLKLSRAARVCGTGRHLVPREQLNENTAFIDGSLIYGSSLKDLSKFRDGGSAFLKMITFNNQSVLPFDLTKCPSRHECIVHFIAGDMRANLFIGLSSMHIIFNREHNRIATTLRRYNPHWSNDRLFEETRKIIGAQIQIINYEEYLPKLLGSSMEQIVGPYEGYDPHVDATISSVFTSAAFRFGHGMITEVFKRFGTSNVSYADYKFRDGIFKSKRVLFEGGIDPILRGLMIMPIKLPQRIALTITEEVFESIDLATVSVERGRDHGIRSYNHWRNFCGKRFANDFDELSDEIRDKNIRDTLKRIYGSPDNVDLYIGAMVEDPVIGGLVGPTLACLVGEQFKRLRDGDRFYYENPGIFTSAQLKELRKVTLASLICNNADNFEVISEDVFLLQGKNVRCRSLQQMDLNMWRD